LLGPCGRIRHRDLTDQRLIYGRHSLPVIDPQCRTGIPLRIEVDDQCANTVEGQARREVDRAGGLPDTTLLVRDGENPPVRRSGEGIRLRVQHSSSSRRLLFDGRATDLLAAGSRGIRARLIHCHLPQSTVCSAPVPTVHGFTWNITSDGASNSTSLYVVLRGLVADPVSTGSSIPQSPVRPKFRNRRSPPGCSGHRTIASPRGPEPLHPSRWLPSWPQPARPVAPTEDTTRKTGRVAPMHAPSPRRTSHIGRVPHVPLPRPVLPAREAPTRPRLLP